MPGVRPGLAIGLTVALLAAHPAASALRINGSTTVSPVVAEAAEVLRAEQGMAITVDTQGGSSGGIAGIGNRTIDIGMASRPLSGDDARRFTGVDLVATAIGADGVALVVSDDVHAAGVRQLSRAEVRAIYEGRVTNWKELGGPDRRIVFFNKEPGRGTWEVFAHWLYGEVQAAPLVSLPEVGANEETRTKVASTRGAMSQLSASWAGPGSGVHTLSIRLDDGTVVAPSPQAIASGQYPLARPLILVTAGPPTGEAKQFIDFVLGARGQALVRKHGYLAVDELAMGELAMDELAMDELAMGELAMDQLAVGSR